MGEAHGIYSVLLSNHGETMQQREKKITKKSEKVKEDEGGNLKT